MVVIGNQLNLVNFRWVLQRSNTTKLDEIALIITCVVVIGQYYKDKSF